MTFLKIQGHFHESFNNRFSKNNSAYLWENIILVSIIPQMQSAYETNILFRLPMYKILF